MAFESWIKLITEGLRVMEHSSLRTKSARCVYDE